MSTTETKPIPTPALVTADELFVEYRNQRCELVEGKVKIMSPTGFGHGALELAIAKLLAAFVAEHSLGTIVTGEVGFVIETNPDTVLAPDVAYVRQERIEAVGVTDKFFPEAPTLAIEIVSPSDTAEDVDSKARRWLTAGTEAVWVVYPKGKSITVYESLHDIRIVTGEQLLECEKVLPGFRLKVSELFADLV